MGRIDLRDASGTCNASVLPEFGFNLFRLTVDGNEVLWAHADVEKGTTRPSGSGLPILFPFPGRLSARTFRWNNRDYTLQSDDGLGHAIHGFVLDRAWRVVNRQASEVTGEFQPSLDAPELIGQWPSDFRIRCRYRLQAGGLYASYHVENMGDECLPCGLGTHAYFCIPSDIAAVKKCLLQFSAKSHWQLDNMLTVGKGAQLRDNGRYDLFRTGISLQGLQLDDVFSDIDVVDGLAVASIVDQSARRKMTLTWDESCGTFVVYTPPHGEAVCIEPCSITPGGFGFAGNDAGLQVLAPGEHFEHRLSIVLDH
ncbi:MAG: aldose 1-epimerase [Planctomycetaceae bacterium]|nr:aldose 1-epimerase [Planctomycetaceae bacterium]